MLSSLELLEPETTARMFSEAEHIPATATSQRRRLPYKGITVHGERGGHTTPPVRGVGRLPARQIGDRARLFKSIASTMPSGWTDFRHLFIHDAHNLRTGYGQIRHLVVTLVVPRFLAFPFEFLVTVVRFPNPIVLGLGLGCRKRNYNQVVVFVGHGNLHRWARVAYDKGVCYRGLGFVTFRGIDRMAVCDFSKRGQERGGRLR